MRAPLAALACALCACAAFAQQPEAARLHGASLAAPAPAARPVRGAIYAPAYASVRFGGGKAQLEMSTTLSLHNTSRDTPLVVERVDYCDTHGKLVQSFLKAPGALAPLATLEAFVPADDSRGGSGANFLIEWSAAGPISKPAVETVMMGSIGVTSYSFVSPGRDIEPAK